MSEPKRRLAFTQEESVLIQLALTDAAAATNRKFIKAFDEGMQGEAKRLRAEAIRQQEILSRFTALDFNVTEPNDDK